MPWVLGGLRQIHLPYLVSAAIHKFSQADERDPPGTPGQPGKGERGIVQQLVALACVALLATAHQILPLGASAMALGDYVVYREVFGGGAAVLAGVVVTREDAAPREPQAWHGASHMVFQANDARAGYLRAGRVDGQVVAVQHIHLAQADQSDCPSHVADIDGLVVTV